MIFDTRRSHFVSNRGFILVDTPPLGHLARFDNYIARYKRQFVRCVHATLARRWDGAPRSGHRTVGSCDNLLAETAKA